MLEEAGKVLVLQYGLTGVLLVAMGFGVWAMLRWFMAELDTKRKDNIAAAADQRGVFVATLTELTESHAASIRSVVERHESVQKDAAARHEAVQKDAAARHEAVQKDATSRHEAVQKDATSRHEAALVRIEVRFEKTTEAICERLERIEGAVRWHGDKESDPEFRRRTKEQDEALQKRQPRQKGEA